MVPRFRLTPTAIYGIELGGSFPDHLYARPKSAAACFLCSATWRVWPERRYRDHVEIRAVSKLEARAIGADLLGLPSGTVRVQFVRERLASKGVC